MQKFIDHFLKGEPLIHISSEMEQFFQKLQHELYRVVDVNGIKVPFFVTHYIQMVELNTENRLVFYAKPIPLMMLKQRDILYSFEPKKNNLSQYNTHYFVLADLDGSCLEDKADKFKFYNRDPYYDYRTDAIIASFSIETQNSYIVNTQEWIDRRLTWCSPNDLLSYYPVIPCETILPKPLLAIINDCFSKQDERHCEQVQFSLSGTECIIQLTDIIKQLSSVFFEYHLPTTIDVIDDKNDVNDGRFHHIEELIPYILNNMEEQGDCQINIKNVQCEQQAKLFYAIQKYLSYLYHSRHNPDWVNGYEQDVYIQALKIPISQAVVQVKLQNHIQEIHFQYDWFPHSNVMFCQNTTSPNLWNKIFWQQNEITKSA